MRRCRWLFCLALVAPLLGAGSPRAQDITAADAEAALRRASNTEVMALMRQHFPDEYRQVISIFVRETNAGAKPHEVSAAANKPVLELMKRLEAFLPVAGLATLEPALRNQIRLMKDLAAGPDRYCAAYLSQDVRRIDAELPDSIKEWIRRFGPYRMAAMVDGMTRAQRVPPPKAPPDPKLLAELLAAAGLSVQDLKAIQNANDAKTCATFARLYEAALTLPEERRRPIIADLLTN